MTATAEEVWAILREVAESQKETDRRFQETDRQFKETDKRLKELGIQIGGLGEKFGYFTEGMALPSMERILTEQFGMTSIMPRARTRKGGEAMEIDVLAYANGPLNRVMLVEVKSRVKRNAISQLRGLVERFRDFHPEHAAKEIVAVLAGVDWDAGVLEEARDGGLLTASIHDEIFELTSPDGFQPKVW